MVIFVIVACGGLLRVKSITVIETNIKKKFWEELIA
jgi:hypothetical protein